jgi:signal transduction histidine kinase
MLSCNAVPAADVIACSSSPVTFMNVVDKLKRISPWHYIWISVVFSELFTAILSTIQGNLWWGGVSRETLIIGAIDALVVPLIVATVVIYFIKQTTELKRINDQLQEANRKLQSIDKVKSDLVSVVSHELRQPLTTIKAFVELLLIKSGMPEQRKMRLLGIISIEADRLARLITDLLDLARIEGGAMKWRTERLSIGDIVQASLASLGPLFENSGIQLSREISASLPFFFGDRDRLVQVVTNILSNAAKFTPPGGAVHIAARQTTTPQAQLIVDISDTGTGIPPEDIELIFEKFHRSGDHLTSTTDGTGLGLAIARQIVEHYGGRIWATSERGKGSVFTFTLPLTGADMQARP